MTRKSSVEARLERSLRNQVRAPRLDGRFDAAVWARIEAEQVKMAAPVVPSARSAASRWIFASNVVGGLVTVALVIYFGIQSFLAEGVSLAVPEVSTGLVERLVSTLSWPVTIVALSVGLMFTPLGRRLRAELG